MGPLQHESARRLRTVMLEGSLCLFGQPWALPGPSVVHADAAAFCRTLGPCTRPMLYAHACLIFHDRTQ